MVHCPETYPTCYATRLVCCTSAAAVGGIASIDRLVFANVAYRELSTCVYIVVDHSLGPQTVPLLESSTPVQTIRVYHALV